MKYIEQTKITENESGPTLNLNPIKIIGCVAQWLNTSKDDLSVVLVTVYDRLR